MINKYIGIPWVRGGAEITGADCWGLVLMVLSDVYGVEVQNRKGCCAMGAELAQVIDEETGSSDWQECSYRDGAVAVMVDRTTKRPEHVGICVWHGTGERMVLHSISTRANGASKITPLPVIERAFLKVRFFEYVGNNC